MFRYESTNKNNEKDKKNSIDIDDFEKLYELLKKKGKEENERKLCNDEYQNIWENIGDIIFKKESINKSEIIDFSKGKIDVTKNKVLGNDYINLEIKDNMSLELIFKIVRYKEASNFINSYDNDYDNYLNEEEEPPIIKAIINEIQNLEKLLLKSQKNL